MAPPTARHPTARAVWCATRCARRLIAFASLIALTLPLSSPAQNLIWENQGMTNAFGINSGRTFNYNGATVTLTWSTNTDGGTFAYAYGSNYVSYMSTAAGGSSGNVRLGFDNSTRDPDDWITLTLTFSQAQTNLAFSLLDIDQASWDDGVDVVYNGATNVRSTPSVWSFGQTNAALRTVITDNETYFQGWEGDRANSDPDQNYGNVNLNFNGIAINSVTIRFFSTDDANGQGNDPGSQFIAISDLTVVPEPPALAGAALALLLLLAARRRMR